ncbi:MAG: sodium-translocating pyrophosphatase [Acidobacteria bacterium]|jgi:K(+)-stimulated pyrophosphate-energized sodium pump|nr:MAG: sodium-translocating pyrophosphatase [Acidobacteriota bacterium]
MSAEGWVWFVMLVSAGSLLMAVLFTRQVLGADTGTAAMQEIAAAIKEGAEAFLRRQYSTIYMLSLALAAVIFFFYLSSKGMTLAWKTTVAFAVGAICSGIAGFSGMFVSIRANLRAASAARSSLARALQLALRGGAVTGLSVVAMSLLGVGVLFLAFGGMKDPTSVPYQLVGFGFGASFVALFAQLGGGIFTKAADVGADLVGKVEAGIPEDDPRNPAVIADLVGDNVGDCAGRGADLFESTAAENVGAMILGVALYQKLGPQYGILAIFFPLVARAFGLIASIAGVFSVRLKNENQDPMSALNRGYLVTTVLAMAGFYIAVRYLLGNNLWFFAAGVIGIVTSFLFVWITQYYTEYRYRPVLSIAEASKTGPATNIITGFAVALECTALPVLTISAAILGSYYCGKQGMPDLPAAGLYGTAIATMGMLSTAAYILAMDTFGPITDNAGGIIEMSGAPEDVRKRTDRLDSVGNTTKALTKGYAIGSAALAAFLLFSAYLEDVTKLVREKTGDPLYVFSHVDIAKVPVFIAALIGAALVFLFSAFAIKAVGRAAYFVIEEVRRQFRENPGIMQGTAKPDYGRCVDIVTVGALKAMVVPGLLAVGVPVAVGVIFKFLATGDATIGAESVAAVLMVGTISGILLATLMNNGGGAWDNAKKYIETGQFGGKRSDAHKAAVVGDTVGDPFKDTAGPSLHVLIKLLSTITLVMAPLFL